MLKSVQCNENNTVSYMKTYGSIRCMYVDLTLKVERSCTGDIHGVHPPFPL